MPTNNQPIDPFQIAALAGFAKNCNLINSQQFSAIINSGAKRLDPSIFIVQDVPDWIFYDKVGFKGFKTAIEGVVFNSFFRLMQKDSVFAAKMARNILKLGTGLLNAESFKQLIIDEIGDVINNIAVRISNGEQLTGAEIEQLIEGGIKRKEDEIRDRGQKLENSDPNEPTGGDTIFPNIALQQKTKGLRWRAIKGTSLSPKQLERIKKTTENIKKQVEKARGALRTARSIVQLLKMLESIYANGLTGIVRAVAKIVFSFVRDIGSSGVYMLDVVGPYMHWQEDVITNPKKATRAKKTAAYLRRKIEKGKIASTYEYMNNDLVNSFPFLNDWIEPPTSDDSPVLQKFDNWRKLLEAFEQDVNVIYRPTTYASFIQIIADAFLDDGDIASYGLKSDLDKYFQKKILGGPTISKERTERGIISAIASNGGDNFARVGRPVFGKGSNVTVTIVAFSMPNFFNMLSLGAATLRSFLMILSFFGKKFPLKGDQFNLLSDNEPFIKQMKRAGGKIVSSKLYDYYDAKPEVKVVKKATGEEIAEIEVNAGLTSQDPDFYGIAVRNIIPAFFRYIDKLESQTNELLKNFKSSLSKELDKLLKNIEKYIDDLEDFLDILDAVISFFETLQTMGLSTLTFTSNGGNEDIVEKLLTAENFPGVAEGDKLRLIGGFVFCYGIPDPNPGKIDFSGLIKEKMAAIDYEVAVAKFESSGGSEDDPGSFNDFMNSQGIGTSYISALDKIFKNLF